MTIGKILSVILCLLMVAIVFAVPAKATNGGGDYWTSKAPLPPTYPGPFRAPHGGAAVNDRIYVIGGYGTYGGWSNVNQEYTPATDTWTTKEPMPTPRSGQAICVVSGKVYVIGGHFGADWPTNVVEEYDPATNTWATKAAMPTPRLGLGVGVVNSKIYAIGGFLNYWTFTPTAVVEEYDPATDTWTTRAPMFTPRADAAIGVVNDKIYVIAGWVIEEEFGYGVGANEEYTPPSPPSPVATIDIDPDTINLKSKAKWITCYIELPEGYDVADVDVATVSLEGVIPAVTGPRYAFVTDPSVYITDKDGDGILERMVKFDAAALRTHLNGQLGTVTLTVAGNLFDGTPFEGTDTIKVTDK